MTRATPLAILTLFAAAVASPPAFPAEDSASGPVAVVPQPVFDAGEVTVGEPIQAEFVIENQGDAPLEITRVETSCGCTVAEYDASIAPGATGRVRAVVDTTSEFGPNSKLINVLTNDPENGQFLLTITSDVKTFLVVEPGYARFTTFVRNDRDQSLPQILWTEDFAELEIAEIEVSEPWIDVSHREASETERVAAGAGKQWRVDVTLTKEAPVGPVAQRVLVRTNHPKQAVVEIPVSGFVRPMVAVMPPDLNFGRIDPAEARQHGILVRNFGSTPLEIEEVDSTVEGIEVTIEPLQNGQQYRLVLKPTAGMAKGPFRGRVDLLTNLPQHPKLTVNVRGEVL